MKPINCVAIAVALGLACGAGDDAARAGGFCGDKLEGGIATKATEDEARSAAISWWSSRAGSLGRGYEHWESAADPDVTCKIEGTGKVSCIASARPCLPDGVLPDDKPRMNL